MDGSWSDFVIGLDEDPTLSLAAVDFSVQHGDMAQGLVDWDSLHVVESQDEEGRIEIVDDTRMYELLGLTAEDEAAERPNEGVQNANDAPASGNDSFDPTDRIGAAIPVDDSIECSSPQRPTMESIIQESPIRVTRNRLAMLLGQVTDASPIKETPRANKTPPRKLTPRRMK